MTVRTFFESGAGIFALCLLLTALLAGTALMIWILKKKPKTETAVALCVIVFGLFYLMAITPLSAPDDGHHYKSTYVMVNDILGREDIRSGEAQDFDFTAYARHENVPSAYERILQTAFSPRRENDVLIQIEGPYQYNYPCEYMLPAIGVLLARLLGLNAFWVYALGRLTNLLGYALLVWLAVKRIPKFKLLLGLIALLPMSMQQASGFSYDCIINGCSFLLIASLVYSIYRTDRFTLKELLWIVIPGLILGPVKGIYALTAAAAFLIPKKRFAEKRQKTAIILPAVLAVFAFAALGYLKWETKAVGYAPAADTVSAQLPPKYTYGEILASPGEALSLIGSTLWQKGAELAEEMFGYHLSGVTLRMNPFLIAGFGLLVLFALHANRGKEKAVIPKPGHRILYLCIFLLTVLVVFVNMIPNETRHGAVTIGGLQGRYFLPALPLAVIALYCSRLEIKKDYDGLILSAEILLSVLSILNILVRTICG